MGLFDDFRWSFESFVENKVFPAVDSVGRAIGNAGDKVVAKISDIENEASINPVGAIASGLAAAAAATAAVAMAPTVVGPAALSATAAKLAASAGGLGAAITGKEVVDAVVVVAATTATGILVDKGIEALVGGSKSEDGEIESEES